MKLSTSLVAIKKITSTVPRSTFADDELEEAAKLILESEGVINPIVVSRTSLQLYEVVDGDYEYYAAARAREIDPRKGEMIGVFILDEENKDTLIKQVKQFRKDKSLPSEKADITSDTLEKFLINFESRFEKITHQLLEEAIAKQRLENEVKELKSQLANNTEPLDVFNCLNKSQIAFRLKSTGITETTAIKIAESVEDERSKNQFESLNDVVNRVKLKSGKRLIKGISSERMLNIIDSWSKISFT